MGDHARWCRCRRCCRSAERGSLSEPRVRVVHGGRWPSSGDSGCALGRPIAPSLITRLGDAFSPIGASDTGRNRVLFEGFRLEGALPHECDQIPWSFHARKRSFVRTWWQPPPQTAASSLGTRGLWAEPPQSVTCPVADSLAGEPDPAMYPTARRTSICGPPELRWGTTCIHAQSRGRSARRSHAFPVFSQLSNLSVAQP